LPERAVGHRWSVRLDKRKRLLRLKGFVPLGMRPQACLDLLNSFLRAHHAQNLLRERQAAAAG